MRNIKPKLQHVIPPLQTVYHNSKPDSPYRLPSACEINEIYNNAPCGYCTADEEGVIIRMNDTLLEWLGYSRENIVGKRKINDLLTTENLVSFQKLFPVLKRKGYLEDMEVVLVKADGSSFPVLVNATAIYNMKGKYDMSSFVIQDRSEKMAIQKEVLEKEEELKKQKKEIDKLHEDRDNFTNVTSHELQHPLAVISIMSKALLQKQNEKLSENAAGMVGMIHDSAREMITLVKNYLDIIRYENTRLLIKPGRVNVTKLIQGIAKKYEEVAKRKDINLHVPIEKDHYILTNTVCLAQIVENLLSNAIKYTEQNKNVYVSIRESNKQTFIKVRDEGVGIKKEEMPLLFKKFQRLSSKPTGGESSTGLGLSIVKLLADQLGCKIAVISEPNKGTSFTVIFSNA